jgi:hypothetical protein
MSRDRIAQFAVAVLNTLGNNDDMALITLPIAQFADTRLKFPVPFPTFSKSVQSSLQNGDIWYI